jgi:uncharacterized protein with HEPN domain
MRARTFADVLKYLEDMRDYAEKAKAYSRGRTLGDLAADEPYRFSILYPLQVVGEAATRVPEAVRCLAPEIPWDLISGFRHHLVHGYGRVRLDKVQSILDSELPPLLWSLEKLIVVVEQYGEAPIPQKEG